MVFVDSLINGNIYIFPPPIPVAMTTKFGTKLACRECAWVNTSQHKTKS